MSFVMNNGHMFLFAGVLLSASGAIMIRWNEGIALDLNTAIAFLFLNSGIILWSFSLKTLEFSYTAFIWYALDAVIIVLASVILFKENMGLTKILCILVIVAGIIGLNFVGGERKDISTTESNKEAV